ncbi:MAG: tetratricopeptide repeat protein [Sandaracinaceae bacterium]
MTRTPRFATLALTTLAMTATLASAAAADDPPLAAIRPLEAVPPPPDALPEGEPDIDEQELWELEQEELFFCGGDGGEPSEVDEAYYLLEEGDVRGAFRRIGDALREGRVTDWRRGEALALLAETQLRLGRYGAAVVNYRRALATDPDGVDVGANVGVQVGLATALYLRGLPEQALQIALAAEEAACAGRWAQMACYGVEAVLAHLHRDGSARTASTDVLRTLREANPQLGEDFDRVDRRVARAPELPRPRATREVDAP